jgi:peptidoglycan/xylan/chitin deacetylase (PgdA/CDA1 family)
MTSAHDAATSPPRPGATTSAHDAATSAPRSVGTVAPRVAAPQLTPTSDRPDESTGPASKTATAAPSAEHVVALTFDAGADRGYAADILDILQEQHVLGSFGITGQWAKANPDLVRRMASDGHLVFNHTLDHQSFTGVSDRRGGLSPARRQAELTDADALIAPLIGHSTKPWYRLPYGDDDGRVAADVAPAGYSVKVGWSVDSLGWRGVSADAIVERCTRLAAPNAIYVLHVGRTSQDGPALNRLIAALRSRGFGFERVDRLPTTD